MAFIFQERFQHSGETISRHFHNVLNAVVSLSSEFIQSPQLSITPPQIQYDERFFPFFKDCIGAIDGTHIPAFIEVHKQASFRKGPAIAKAIMAFAKAASFSLTKLPLFPLK
ncbi:hypothetical protein ACHQM5_022419 [Ranunculus cassubicifolius]